MISRRCAICLGLFAFAAGSTLEAQAAPEANSVPQAACEAMASTSLPPLEGVSSRITEATLINDHGNSAYCRVSGYIESQVGFQVWLPTKNWNHKLIEFGCGGWCGSIEYGTEVARCPGTGGYACVATDTGHTGTVFDALWAAENWQAKINWAYLATHLTATLAKAAVTRFYGSPPEKSYFLGASGGGRQALIEAQRFPWDFDGVVAVAPPIDISQTLLRLVWGMQAVRDKSGTVLLGASELKLLTRGALNKCDSDDGLKDGIISDPLHCNFNPSELLCKQSGQQNCLSEAQVAAAKKVYQGPVTSSGLPLTLGGPLPGSEHPDELPDIDGDWSGWMKFAAPEGQQYSLLVSDGLCYLFFSSCTTESWSLSAFSFDRDYKRLRAMEPLYDASDPDLRRFREAGGKLIIVEGLSDQIVSPRDVIDYYQAIQREMGGREATDSFARLFLLPGVGHGGGSGAGALDLIGAIDGWVQRRIPPDRLIAARVKKSSNMREQISITGYQFPPDPASIQFTRPVYPYPTRVKYQGHGDANDASSFIPVR